MQIIETMESQWADLYICELNFMILVTLQGGEIKFRWEVLDNFGKTKLHAYQKPCLKINSRYITESKPYICKA